MRPTNLQRVIAVNRRPAFTLIEVLVVVAIIALLVSILLPSLSRAKAQARMVNCQSNIRQVMMAFLVYATENRNCLPGHSKDSEADWLGPPTTTSATLRFRRCSPRTGPFTGTWANPPRPTPAPTTSANGPIRQRPEGVRLQLHLQRLTVRRAG